ncbi:MAG: DUF4411 family protein [Phycisphaerales bacterium JB039]
MRFSIDTSTLIGFYTRTHAPDVAPGLWVRLAEQIDLGVVTASEEVIEEIKNPEGLVAWIKERDSNLRRATDDDIMEEVSRIVNRHYRPDFFETPGDNADPFVAAVAMVDGCDVVCDEKRHGGPTKKKSPKLPDLCDELGIQCVRALDFQRAIGVRLVMDPNSEGA